MAPESDVRSRYLTLALEARKVIHLLLPLVETGQTDPQLAHSLGELARSLELPATPAALLAKLQAHRQEGWTTLEDMESSKERSQLATEIRNVVRQAADSRSVKASAKQAILLLSALEGGALKKFSESSKAQALPTLAL